jgi:hypothetical protein
MRLNKNLVDLLRDLGERVDEKDKKMINEALHDVCPYTHSPFATTYCDGHWLT